MKLNGNSGSHGEPKNKRPKGSGKNPLRRILIVLASVILVVSAVVIGYSLWEAPPDVGRPGIDSPQLGGDEIKDPVSSSPGTDPQPTETEEPYVDEYEGALDTHRDDGVYTCLVVGRDKASNSTDTIIVGKFDTVNHTIECVNIPRDTLINISWAGTPKKINTVYAGYNNSGNDGIAGLKSHVEKIMGFTIDCYAIVTVEAVQEAIDCIGGVYFDIPIRMLWIDPTQDYHLDLQPGYQHLDGETALNVFRYRQGYSEEQTYPDGDLGRIRVQQDLLKAVASQMLTLGNIPNLPELINILVSNVETDLTAANMMFFARQFLKCSMADINFHTVPMSGACVINGLSYVSIDVNAWLEILNAYLNPFTEDITTANVDILTSNYGGSYINSTSGYIAGGWESFYCTSCTAASGVGTGHASGPCPVSEPEPEPETEPEDEPLPETE